MLFYISSLLYSQFRMISIWYILSWNPSIFLNCWLFKIFWWLITYSAIQNIPDYNSYDYSSYLKGWSMIKWDNAVMGINHGSNIRPPGSEDVTSIHNPKRARTELLGFTRPLSWLLMLWLLAAPGHQQPWYWLCRISKFLSSSSRRNFNDLCLISVEE